MTSDVVFISYHVLQFYDVNFFYLFTKHDFKLGMFIAVSWSNSKLLNGVYRLLGILFDW